MNKIDKIKLTLINMLSEDAKISSSRVYAGITLFMYFLVAALSILEKFNPDVEIFKGLVTIFAICMTSATGSKFSSKEKK